MINKNLSDRRESVGILQRQDGCCGSTSPEHRQACRSDCRARRWTNSRNKYACRTDHPERTVL